MRGHDFLRAAAERDRVAQKTLSKRVALLPPGAHDDCAPTRRSPYELYHLANGRAVAAELEKEVDAIYDKYAAPKATKRDAPEKRAPGTCSPPVPPRARGIAAPFRARDAVPVCVDAIDRSEFRRGDRVDYTERQRPESKRRRLGHKPEGNAECSSAVTDDAPITDCEKEEKEVVSFPQVDISAMNTRRVPAVVATSPVAPVSPQRSEDEPSTSAFAALAAHLRRQGLQIEYNPARRSHWNASAVHGGSVR